MTEIRFKEIEFEGQIYRVQALDEPNEKQAPTRPFTPLSATEQRKQHLLAVIGEHEKGVSTTALGRITGWYTSTLVRALTQLVADGKLVVSLDSNKGRCWALPPTKTETEVK
jgi:predicted HTH transcriptional regulator